MVWGSDQHSDPGITLPLEYPPGMGNDTFQLRCFREINFTDQ